MVKITHHQQDGIVGGVEPVLIELTVFELIGHVQDVLQIAERCVLIAVFDKGRVPEQFGEPAAGIRNAGVILSFYDRSFGLEHLFVIIQVDETVGFGLHNPFQVLPPGEYDKIDRLIVRSITVGPRSQFGEEVIVHGTGNRWGSLEHHMLEEMGESGFPRFDLVA